MKRLLYFLLLFFANSFLYSQFDTEHWFAPFANQNSSYSSCYLYLSTNTSTPFKVDIYSSNVLINTVEISKNSPSVVYVNSEIMFTDPDDVTYLNTSTNKGLHLVGEKKFFAHFRFSVPNHAEIITSKGKAGVGKNFYVVTPPNRVVNAYTNSTFGILATEDQTTIKISGYDPNLTFFGVSSPTPTSFNITLNKGESYISSVLTSQNSGIISNKGLLTGTRIESNKPISLTNGDFNGMYSPTTLTNSSDILMDQAIPTDRLGNEFIIMSGYGSISPNNNYMEEVIVLASEDNTEVYLNNSTTPYVILNKGESEIINDDSSEGGYFEQKNGDAYTMYIKTSKKSYAYQLLAGVPNSYATGGYNIVPPLNCLLPNKIEEFALVNEIGDSKFNVKMNIIAEKGAQVKMNGIPISASFGPYSVSGNNNWETYSVPNVTGNITISADKAVTAGIAAGSQNVGFGGYFAGFNSNPIISKGGDCDKNNVTLEVDDTYDSYQWFFNGAPYTGSGSNTYIIHPTLSGAYYVMISKVGCGSITAPTYNFSACTLYTSKDYNIGSCNTIKILPKFTKSAQNIAPSSVTIKTPPTNGTATINPTTGEITYTVTNPNATSDKFVYYFSGDNINYPDSEQVTVNITITPLKVYNGVSKACVNNGIGRFNIDDVKLTDDTSATYQYYKTYSAADTQDASQEITTLHPYLSDIGKVYVRITDSFGCYKIAEIELLDSQPNVNTNNYDSSHCDDDFDGIINVKFSDISPIIVNEYKDFTIEYYLNPNFTGTPLPNDWSYSQDTDVYVRVFSQAVCVTAKGIIHFKIGTKIAANDITKQICDGDFNNTENVDLRDYLTFVTSETGYTYAFYASKNDAILEKNAIGNIQSITSNITYFVKLKKAGICDNITSIILNFGQPSKSTTLPNSITICQGDTTTLDAGAGFSSYLWSNGATTQTITVGKGDYTVTLTSNNTCTYTQKVSVLESPKAIVDITKYNSTICDNNLDGIIEVNLDNVTSAILLNPGIYSVKYYSDAANTKILNTNWSYNTDTTIYVRIESNYCPVQIYPIDFKFGNKVALISDNVSKTECDDNLDAEKSLNLDLYRSFFTSDSSVSITYYNSEADAKNGANPISNNQIINKNKTIYLRFEKSGNCANWGKLTLNINIPTASTTLKDTQICKNATTTIDAGSGFTSYLWSTGEKSQTVIKGVGDYYVDLESSNGCIYRQNVKISIAPDPTIVSVDVVNNNSIIINVSGGNPPYEYSIDGIHYQSENTFSNLPKGLQKVYVRGKEKCNPIEKEFLIINLINAITPNGDGRNEILDYSDLRIKKEVKILVYDRYGNSIYKEINTQKYTWDGKVNGRIVPTGTYWYVIEWTEPDTGIKMSYKGWILVKNRN